MPNYESITNVSMNVFDGSTVCSTSMDISGDPVEAWAQLVLLSSQIYKFQQLLKTKDNDRFKFQFDNCILAMKRLRINSKMRKNPAFYQKVKKFQYVETLKWRGKPKEANVIVPPISPHDETTNTGAAKVILLLLVMYGILKNRVDENMTDTPDVANLRLAHDAKEHYLIMVGDGLTQIRAKQFAEIIEESSSSYGPRQRTSMMIQRALDQVIFIHGDLHGGGFHIMQVIYNLFYGAIIQKVQTVLKWKQICGSDVSKCYQQVASLATVLATEMERHFTSKYIKSVYESDDEKRAFNNIQDSQEFAIFVAKGYTRWIREKRRSTDDQVFRMAINFVSAMNLYRLLRVSVRAGDSIMIEWIYKEVIPLFNITGKKHYFELSLKQIKDLYDKIPYKYLHLARINRTVPLYDGLSKQGEPMANWALDSFIETVQKYYHKMSFHTGKGNEWLKHSSHVMVMSKASRTVVEVYSRLNCDEDKDLKFVDHQDSNLKHSKMYKNTKPSSTPKQN